MQSFKRLLVFVSFVLFSVALTGCDDDDDGGPGPDPGGDATTFDVTIENLAAPLPLLKSGAFNTPVGASSPGPVTPGNAYEFSFTAGPNEVPGSGMQLSFATMFIQSNDLFYAPDPGGIALFESDGTPIGQGTAADVTDEVALWDAGTEVDEEPGTGPNQAPRQSGADTGADEGGDLVRVVDTDADGMLEDSGFEYPAVDDVIRVTVESVEDAASGAYRFTVRIENVSDDTGAQVNGANIPISPGAYAAHFDQVPASGDDVAFFVADAPESMSIDGIEEIAEDGDPSVRGSAAAELTGVTVPLSPGAYAVHSDAVQLYTTGEAASTGIERIAEDGAPSELDGALAGLDGVRSHGTFGSGPLAPTPPDADPPAFTFTIEAEPGDRLSFATMYIQSNDFFYAFDEAGLPLFDGDGVPISGEQAVGLYDAGTEGDEEPGVGLNQAPRQSAANTGPSGEGTVEGVDGSNDGFSYPSSDDVIRVTVTPQ